MLGGSPASGPLRGTAGQYGVLQIYLQIPIRRGGAPSGAAGFIANNLELLTFHYAHQSSSIFMGNPFYLYDDILVGERISLAVHMIRQCIRMLFRI